MFKNIKQLTSLNEQRKFINKQLRHLYKPLLIEESFIQDIWDICNEEYSYVQPTVKKQIFLTVVLLYYSPQKLAGGKISKSVMRTICNVTQSRQSLISHNSENLIFLYDSYRNYREMVDRVNSLVMDRLEENKLISREKLLEYLAKYLV